MAYEDFAFWYDALNTDADYDRYVQVLCGLFEKHGVGPGLVVDLGCGTGECTLRLAGAGYEMIGVDGSANMLSVFRDKIPEKSNILLLCQNLEDLDLYGTVQGAVSTFDTLSHLAPEQLDKTLARVSLFLEPGGVLLFDVNTPYKHREVLGNSCFSLEGEGGVRCFWDNLFHGEEPGARIEISLEIEQNGRRVAAECFEEYAYGLNEWQSRLENHGFALCESMDGERFGPILPDTERFLIVAKKLKSMMGYKVKWKQ